MATWEFDIIDRDTDDIIDTVQFSDDDGLDYSQLWEEAEIGDVELAEYAGVELEDGQTTSPPSLVSQDSDD